LEAEGRSSIIRMRPGGGRGSLQRNVIWALVGNVGYTVFQWGILVCIAKLGNASDVGAFALGLAVTAPIITLANLHLRVLELGGNIVVAKMTMALCWMVLLGFYDLPAAYRLSSIRPAADPRALKSLALMAAPMGCVAALGSLTANVPRYAVEGNLGPTALGHFAAIAYLFVAGGQPMMALGAAVTPRLARCFVTDLGAYRQLTRKTVLSAAALGLLAVAVAAIAGPLVLTIAYAPEYAQEAPMLEWMAVAAGIGFAGKALAAAVTAARRLSVQLPIAITSLAVAALASELLVPRWGLVGAACAVLATEATRLICLGAIYVHAVSSAASAQLSRVPREHIASAG